jgi:hypothetical protein
MNGGIQMKLAECLLRRKELQSHLDRLADIKSRDLFEIRVKRIKVMDGVDEVTANVPKLSASQVNAEYNFYAKALRNIDALIQNCNWTTEVPSSSQWFEDYKAA